MSLVSPAGPLIAPRIDSDVSAILRWTEEGGSEVNNLFCIVGAKIDKYRVI